MDLADEIERIEKEEAELELPRLSDTDIWTLGSRLREQSIKRGGSIAIQIIRGGVNAFSHLAGRATADDLDWARRKAAVSQRFDRSRLRMALMLEAKRKTLSERYAIPEAEFAAAGGAMPLRVRGVGLVGAVAVSGFSESEDHDLVCEALAALIASQAVTGPGDVK